MTTAAAITGWAVAALIAWLSVYSNRHVDALLGKIGDIAADLYTENCDLLDKMADKNAVILRQQAIIEAKNAELDRIGVRRNAKGRLESIK